MLQTLLLDAFTNSAPKVDDGLLDGVVTSLGIAGGRISSTSPVLDNDPSQLTAANTCLVSLGFDGLWAPLAAVEKFIIFLTKIN